MAPVVKGGLVAVTGAAGFIGGWVTRNLLDKGYRVRACVRNPDDEAKTGFLKALPGYASGRLTLCAADLDHPGCFDVAFRGANAVAHVSHISRYTDEAYIRGVCEHVIASVEASQSVNRVVVTSSIAAVMSEVDLQDYVRRPVFYEDRWPDEVNPRRTLDRQGYSIGKVLAEHLLAEAAEKSGRWDSIACCPGDNVGPVQSAHQAVGGAWQSQIGKMLAGEYPQNGAYRPWMTVDVRDDADGHIGLLESASVKNGERYIACSTERRNVEDVCASIDRLLPELRFAGARLVDPFPDRIKAREAEMRAIWAGTELRNDRIRAATGVTFRPLDESIRDCVESLIAIAGVEPVRRPVATAEVEPATA
jgi:nucleoside-diphosphate-sugar epimerase